MTSHRIDVLVPVYNGAPWLRASIESLQRQSHRDLCIHVVDDGSSDDTPAILAELAAGDERIHVHARANGGIVAALNHGLAFCTSEWLARHDADDAAAPHRLETQLAYLLAEPGCVAVGAMARHIDGSGVPMGSVTQLRPPELADPDWFPAREPYLMHPFMLARRAAIVAAGGYRRVPQAEDSDLYWRLREHGALHNLDDVLGDYRRHDASLSSASIANGRSMAIHSQLAALSARRRRDGRDDLNFDGAAIAKPPLSLRDDVAAAASGLHAEERERFAVAVAAKLLELASYQPYELDAADCTCIGETMRATSSMPLSAANRDELASQLARTAVRLLRAGRGGDALRLLPTSLLPRFLARLAYEAGLPAALRRRLHAARATARASLGGA